MKKLLSLLIVYVFSTHLFSQNLFPSGARTQSLANSTTASIDFWSLVSAPSNMTFTNNTSIGVDIQNNFMVKELSSVTLAMSIPINNRSNLSFYLQRYGYSIFNENKLAISFANKLSKYTSAAIQISDKIQFIKTEQSSIINHILAFNIGFFAKINPKFHISSQFYYTQSIENNSPNNIQELALGISWFPVDELNVLLSISKNNKTKVSIRGGIEYSILKRIKARVGISSYPFNASLGLGILFKTLTIDISATHNQYLGTGSSISGNYNFRN